MLRTRSIWSLPVASIVMVLWASAPSLAEVKIVQKPDGSLLVYNVGGSRPKARRVTPRRQPLVSPQDREQFRSLAADYARSVSLEPELVWAVIQAESAFNPRALSSKGAMGLMQLMPATAASYSVDDPYDPSENMRAGTHYLRKMLDTFGGSVELALAAYNAGPQAVSRFQGIPPYRETQNYVQKVMRMYRGDDSYMLADSSNARRGRKTYLTRDASGRLVMTTTPPKS